VYEADNSSRHEPAVVADGLVFVPTRDGLQVLNNETGVTVWNETEISVDHVSVSEGVAVTTSSFDSEIRAYDAMTGEEQWNVTNFDARNIVVSNGTIFNQRENPAVHGGRESRPFRDATAASGTAGTPPKPLSRPQTCVSIGLRHIPLRTSAGCGPHSTHVCGAREARLMAFGRQGVNRADTEPRGSTDW